jgi:hypothetical protein
LENLWFPRTADDVFLPVPDDATVAAEVVEPLDEDGSFTVRVTLRGATFGDNTVTPREDPETGLRPKFPLGPVIMTPPVPEACAALERCVEADFELTLPSGFVDDPPDSYEVEMLTADGLPFAPPVRAEFDPTTG